MRTLTAFYDLEQGPISYDFITWLVRARWTATEQGCTGLHVVLVPHEAGLGGFSRHWGPHDAADARWRLWHIVIPACALAGATVALAPSRQHAAHEIVSAPIWWPAGKAHLAEWLVKVARDRSRTGAGEIPRLQATEGARRFVRSWLGKLGPKVVTLTMRNQENDPARNADRAAWSKLGQWLVDEGWEVVDLFDTRDALREGRGYAELDIDLRLALYEQAQMNIVGNNGPAALLWHSEAPYLRVGAGQVADWTTNLGLQQGEQLPWARADQVCVYGPADFPTMRAAFEKWAGATS